MSRRLTTEEFIQRAKAVHGDRYDYSMAEYTGRDKPVRIICKKHGEFLQMPFVHVGQGHGCPACGREAQAVTNMAKYGVPVSSQAESVKAKARETNRRLYGGDGPQCDPEVRAKGAASFRARYGADNAMGVAAFREKIRETNLARRGTEWASQDPEVRRKQSETCRERYGGASPLCDSSVVGKVMAAKARNHTFAASEPEDRAYALLCGKFGEDSVERQYRSAAYPFACDFYVKPLDLYIEMNVSWTHGGKFFDPEDPADLDKLRLWKERAVNSKFYGNAIHVWTEADPEKLAAARRNGLNYLAFWRYDLGDFITWLEGVEL